jgi:hypothetical protein
MLHGLKLVEGTPELHPLAGVRHSEVARRIERADDLVAARPRAAAVSSSATPTSTVRNR